MRLTRALLRGDSHRWKFRMIWQHKALYKEHVVLQPSFVKDAGIKVVNAADFVKDPPKFPIWESPVKDEHRFSPPKTIKDDPDYHEDPVYEFHPECRLIEGTTQACVLTKSQPFYELPPAVADIERAPKIPDQDMLVQRVIMQANLWDPTKDKLPRRYDPAQPIWKFKAEWGIPVKRRISIMIKNLMRLCEMLGGWYPTLSASRRTVYDPYLSMFYYFQEKHIMIRGLHNLMVYSNQPLPPFADEEMVDASTSHVMPDMFPIGPTIDLRKQHVWRPENITGIREGFPHRYPQLLFIGYENNWTASQRNALALLYSFGHAVALAKQLYGWETKVLPEPISTQCVLTDGDIFRFVCFQLNTLNFDTSDGVKNLVWFDEDERPLFNRLMPKRAMLRNTRYLDYDPNVFRQLVSFYVNGVNLSDTDNRVQEVPSTAATVQHA